MVAETRSMLERKRRTSKSKRELLSKSFEMFKQGATVDRPLREKLFSEGYEQIADLLAGSLTGSERERIVRSQGFQRKVFLDHYKNIRPIVYHTLSLDEILSSKPLPAKGFRGTPSDKLLLTIKKVREDPTLSRRAKLDYLNLLKLKAELDKGFQRGLEHTPKRLYEKTGRTTRDRFDYLVKLLEKDVLAPPKKRDRIKVLRVSHDYNRNEGGVQKHLQELNFALNQNKGIELHQVLPISKSDLNKMVSEGKIEKKGEEFFDPFSKAQIHPVLVDYKPSERIPRLNRSAVAKSYMRQMVATFSDINPDIVHVHNGYYKPHRDLAKFAKEKGKKIVHTWHGGDITADRLRTIHDETAGLADYNFAVCTSGKLAFSNEEERKKVGIAYGVNLEKFDPKKVKPGEVEKLRESMGVKAKDFVYFFPGRYNNQKNQHTLVNAFAQVAERDPNTKLVLAGPVFNDPEGTKYMEDLYKIIDENGLRDRVIVRDKVTSSDEMRTFYAASDAVVYPSKNEGRGRSLAEAMAMGKPVLASGDAGLRESIERPEGRKGLLFDPDSLEGIVDSMAQVKDNPVLRTDLELKAREYAQGELSLISYAQKYHDLYTELVAA